MTLDFRLTDDQRQAVKQRIEEIYEDEWDTLKDVNFRDYEDEDEGWKGTVITINVFSHRSSVNIPDRLPVLGADDKDGRLWKLQIDGHDLEF